MTVLEGSCKQLPCRCSATERPPGCPFGFSHRHSVSVFLQILFQFIYGIHPLLPMAYLLLLATGLLAPALYCAARKIPSIAVIWSCSKAGDRWAKAVVAVYALFAAVTLLALVAELLRR